MPLTVHPAELVDAIWSIDNYDPQYMRVTMYGMKAPLEYVNRRLLDSIVTAVFERRPRCENQFDIAVSRRTTSLIAVKLPTAPAADSVCGWWAENFPLFNCVEARPTADSCIGGCANVFYENVPGLDPAIKKTKFYELVWHLIRATTSCKFKSVGTVKQYRERINVLQSVLQSMEINKGMMSGLRLETRICCLVRNA